MNSIFFAFNLFALINVMLPVLWSVSNTWASRLSALLAVMGFLTLFRPLQRSKRLGRGLGALISLLLLAAVERWGAFVPPAPLRLAGAEFGTSFQREALRLDSVVTELAPGKSIRLYGLTAIKAPLGLKEQEQHRSYQTGELVWASPFYQMIGGREEGFRLWTVFTFDTITPGAELRLDLATEGGQLIGRAGLKAKR